MGGKKERKGAEKGKRGEGRGREGKEESRGEWWRGEKRRGRIRTVQKLSHIISALTIIVSNLICV